MFVRESVAICLFGFFHLSASTAMKGYVLYVHFATQLFQLDQEVQEWKQKNNFVQFSSMHTLRFVCNVHLRICVEDNVQRDPTEVDGGLWHWFEVSQQLVLKV